MKGAPLFAERRTLPQNKQGPQFNVLTWSQEPRRTNFLENTAYTGKSDNISKRSVPELAEFKDCGS